MNTRFRTLLLSCHWLLLMWLGITSPRATADDSRQEARRPNVLFVFSDMQRAYSMGCYGDTNARTPNLDALAKQGVRFDAAIANTPVCCPYRACLMSGQYAHHNGVVSNQVEFRPTVKCSRYPSGARYGPCGRIHETTSSHGAGPLLFSSMNRRATSVTLADLRSVR